MEAKSVCFCLYLSVCPHIVSWKPPTRIQSKDTILFPSEAAEIGEVKQLT